LSAWAPPLTSLGEFTAPPDPRADVEGAGFSIPKNPLSALQASDFGPSG